MKIYIAGRITGNENAEEEFRLAELWLLESGHTPLNPMKNIGFEYKDYIDMGLAELSKCDAIFILDNGFARSRGACLEHYYANIVNLLILYQNNEIHTMAIAACDDAVEIENCIRKEMRRSCILSKKLNLPQEEQ